MDIVWNAWLDESQDGIKMAERIVNNLRYANDTAQTEESEKGTKEPLDEGEGGEWKSWLKN